MRPYMFLVAVGLTAVALLSPGCDRAIEPSASLSQLADILPGALAKPRTARSPLFEIDGLIPWDCYDALNSMTRGGFGSVRVTVSAGSMTAFIDLRRAAPSTTYYVSFNHGTWAGCGYSGIGSMETDAAGNGQASINLPGYLPSIDEFNFILYAGDASQFLATKQMTL